MNTEIYYPSIIDDEITDLTIRERTETVVEKLSPVVEILNNKYKTNYKLEDLETAIKSLSTLSSTEKKLQKCLNSEIATNLIDIVSFRCIFTASFVIECQLKAVMEDDQMVNNFNINTVALVEKLFLWLEKLQDFKKKFNITDVEKQIADIQGNIDTNDDASKKMLINELMSQLKK